MNDEIAVYLKLVLKAFVYLFSVAEKQNVLWQCQSYRTITTCIFTGAVWIRVICNTI